MRKYTLFLVLISITIFQSCKNQVDLEVQPAAFSSTVIERAASRNSGVAPLSVHFAAGFSASSLDNRPFHDLDYSWDFGDPQSGTWGTTGRSKNSAKGGVATHVFENPGNYRVTLTISNHSGVIETETFQITVNDPDVVFAGDKTTCVSTGTDFSGAPAGSRHITTTDLASLAQYGGAGRRLLFRRGDSWTAVDRLVFDNGEGEAVIGAFGPGTNPDGLGIYDNAPRITVEGESLLSLSGMTDWRVEDLHLLDPSNSNTAFGGASNIQRVLLSRIRTEGFNLAVTISNYNTGPLLPHDQIVLNECHFSSCKTNIVYLGGERIALLGNILEMPQMSHVLRVWQAYQGIISNNILSGSSYQSTSGRHALKLHSSELIGEPVQGGRFVENRTEFAIVSDNIFGGSGYWPVGIGPENNLKDQETWDIVFERNRIVADYQPNSSPVSVSLVLWGCFITVRNNVLDGSNSGAEGYRAVSVEQKGIERAPVGVNIYNNTIYRSDLSDANQATFVFAKEVSESRLFNNLICLPHSSNVQMLRNGSPDLEEGNNLLISNPGFLDPDNVNPLIRDFQIGASSEAVNGGVVLGVFDDFNGNPRPPNRNDLGALTAN